jgi:hypothetical protein
MSFFSGSTAARTRLCRIAIALNITEMEKDFWIFGISEKLTGFEKGPFERC